MQALFVWRQQIRHNIHWRSLIASDPCSNGWKVTTTIYYSISIRVALILSIAFVHFIHIRKHIHVPKT